MEDGFTCGFTSVRGLRIGHAHDARVRSGVTLVVPDAPMVMAVDVRGGGPGTRETDALEPHTLVERVHGLVLAGGSVFGLAAADELVLCLSAAGQGLDIGPGLPKVPVVPGAILFDLGNGGDKDWGGAVVQRPKPIDDAGVMRLIVMVVGQALASDGDKLPIGDQRL